MGSASKGHTLAEGFVAVIAHPAAVLDIEGRIRFHNDDFLNSVSQSAGSIQNCLIEEMFQPDDRDAVQQAVKAACCSKSSPRLSVVMPSGAYKLTLDAIGTGDDGLYLCQLTPDHAIDSSRLRFLLEHLNQGVWNYNVLTGQFVVTDAWRRMRGIDLDADINAGGAADGGWIQDLHPEDRDMVRNMFYGQTQGTQREIDIQFRRRLPDGQWIWISCNACVMSYDQNANPVQIVGLDTDISKIKENEAAMTQLAGKMQLAIEVAGIGVWDFDAQTATVSWDARMLEMYGITDGRKERREDLWETFLHPDDLEDTRRYSEHCLANNLDFNCDYRIVRKDGEVRNIRSLARYSKTSHSGNLVGVNIDITDDLHRTQELEAARQQLEHDSRHDALTGLANRRLLDETTASLLAQLQADDLFAVLHIDLDYFKQINDTLGHAAGDRVLVHVADVLRKIVGDTGLVCRVGGDEFVVLLNDVASHREVEVLCKAMIAQAAQPTILEGHDCAVGLSIGCAMGDGTLREAAEVFINADVALYAAKSDGRSRFRVFRKGMVPVSQHEASERQSLRNALEQGEIICYLQPQFDAITRRLSGAEALVRWNSPERGLLTPDQFMPMAQTAGLVSRIDEHVFNHVLAVQTSWAQAGFFVPTVSLNISLGRLRETGIAHEVTEALKAHHSIAFELLETAFLDDTDAALSMTLDALRCAGIRLELDDFGSGHSSVVALQAVRPDRVKIDRRLVAPLCRSRTQIMTLQAMVRLARLEGCDVVMEGIETQDQLEAMAQLDCSVLQGFILARPMSVEDFTSQFVMHHSAAQG